MCWPETWRSDGALVNGSCMSGVPGMNANYRLACPKTDRRGSVGGMSKEREQDSRPYLWELAFHTPMEFPCISGLFRRALHVVYMKIESGRGVLYGRGEFAVGSGEGALVVGHGDGMTLVISHGNVPLDPGLSECPIGNNCKQADDKRACKVCRRTLLNPARGRVQVLMPRISSTWPSRPQADPSTAPDAPVPLPSAGLSSKPPTLKSSSLKGIFHRKTPPQAQSTVSLLSADSLGTESTAHPYAAMAPPRPVLANHDTLDDDQECPVCLEPLSFSFRLPGEKPHVVPECGHSLHEVGSQIFSLLSLSSSLVRPVSLLFMAPFPPSPDLPSLASPTWACAVYAAVP